MSNQAFSYCINLKIDAIRHKEINWRKKLPLKEPFPRSSSGLIKEVDATNRIKDIREIYNLKDTISVKWWETLLVLILFVSGLGFIVSISRLDYLFPPEKSIILKFILFWFMLLVLSLIVTIEFLLNKFRALRKLYEIQTRIIISLQDEMHGRDDEKSAANDDKKQV